MGASTLQSRTRVSGTGFPPIMFAFLALNRVLANNLASRDYVPEIAGSGSHCLLGGIQLSKHLVILVIKQSFKWTKACEGVAHVAMPIPRTRVPELPIHKAVDSN